MAVGKMVDCGWLLEVEANIRRGDPFWCETGDGRGTTLVVTERAQGTGQPQSWHVTMDVPSEGELSLWPWIVRLAPGVGADQTVADPFFSYLRVLEGKETIFLLTRVCNGRPVQAPSNSA